MLRFFVIVVGGAVLLGGSASADDRCDMVKQAVATYGYAAARQHALENYGQEAVAFGDKCLGKSGVVETMVVPETAQFPHRHARLHHRGAVTRSVTPASP
jgi:hypothetical protein